MKYIRSSLKKPEKIIEETIAVLKTGGLVIFPSDTVYGLLVNATNHKAVEKLIRFKNRPPGKPISVFLSGFEMLKSQVKTREDNLKILEELLPGPFTVILDSLHKVDSKLESEKGTLGVRLPDYSLVAELVKRFGQPITATSANISGRSSHYSIETLMKDLSKEKTDLIDLVVDAGQLPRNKPSTIVDLTSSKIKLLRRGDVVFDSSKTYISESSSQTQKLGEFLISKYLESSREKPLVVIIEGELGAGKTMFTKGVAKKLGIDNIVSPTYVIYYEYGNFYHFDLYQIEESQEFEYLGIEKLLKKGNILCFEWGEKIGELYRMLEKKTKIVYVKIEYLDEKTRKITIRD